MDGVDNVTTMGNDTAQKYWFIFYQENLLLTQEGQIPTGNHLPIGLGKPETTLRLPHFLNQPAQAVSIAEPVCAPNFRMVHLRESFDILDYRTYIMAGKARELLYWDSNTQFCSLCGNPMKRHTDISKCCIACGKEVWPQLSPAIIVAVTRGHDEILLVQSKNFRSDYLGLVAGFVETGETLEDCVRREVQEETNISIKNIRYFRSQPWPYPNGLMIGFKAEYESGEIRLQRSELKKGGWYNRNNLPPIPGKVSLARMLIDDWLAEKHDIQAHEHE